MAIRRNDETLDRGLPGDGRGAGPPKRLGPYVIERELARGGMGCVYVAHHAQLGRRVAIKTILGQSPRARIRFQTEAETTARLQHPNIVRIHDVGVERDVPYLVMEFVAGESLKDRLDRGGRLDERKAARIAAVLARALDCAHAAGVLHRDMKPANVLLRDDEPLITDFGLAKDVDADQGLTKTGQLIGTPAYMPPEQAQGKRQLVDARSDVYSLGATLYETLTGRVPFEAASALNLIVAVVSQEPPRPSAHVPGLDAELERICLRCLEKDPAKRFATAGALADALEAWLAAPPTGGGALHWSLGVSAAVLLAVGTLAWALIPSPAADRREAGPRSSDPPETRSPPTTATPPERRPAAESRPRVLLWRRLDVPPVSPARLGLNGAFSFDPHMKELVFFGGRRGSEFLADTWAWTGNEWRKIGASMIPIPLSGRSAHATATDWNRREVLMFGGNLPSRRLQSTKAWRDQAWHAVPVQQHPPRRAWHAMAWDGHHVLLFGGIGLPDAPLKDLWRFKDGEWQEVTPKDGDEWPGPRSGCGMSFDPLRKRVVLFGGNGVTGLPTNDLWEWDGERWHRPAPQGPWPRPRVGMGLAWEGRQTLLFGGSDTVEGRAVRLDDTWAWDGEVWTRRRTGDTPSPRAWHAMSWDPTREVVVLAGGGGERVNTDTWVYEER